MRVLIYAVLACAVLIINVHAKVKSTSDILEFSLANKTVMVLDYGKLGLGSSSPGANLHVSGNAYFSNGLNVGVENGASDICFSGTLENRYVSVSENILLSQSSYYLVDSSQGNITLTLPDPDLFEGRVIQIKKIHESHIVVLQCPQSDVDGSYKYQLESGGRGAIQLIAGSSWHIINSVLASPISFSPRAIPSLQMWYDASDSTTITKDASDNVMTWSDKSLSQHDGYQDIDGAHPKVASSIQNGLNGLYFNGMDDSLKITNPFNMKNSGTIILMAKIISGGNSSHGDFLFNINNKNDNGRFYLRPYTTQTSATVHSGPLSTSGAPVGTMDSATHCILSKWELGVNVLCSVDGGNPATVGLSSDASNTWMGTEGRLCSNRTDDGNFLECYLFEILYFEDYLSDRDTAILEAYLCKKWGVQDQLPNTHPYKNIGLP